MFLSMFRAIFQAGRTYIQLGFETDCSEVSRTQNQSKLLKTRVSVTHVLNRSSSGFLLDDGENGDGLSHHRDNSECN